MLEHMVDEALQRGEAARPPDQPTVQSDRKHLRRVHAFGIEHIE